MRTVLLLCAILLALSTHAVNADQASDLPVLKTKVKTLAAFKNGLGFVYRAGQTNLKDGWTVLEELPPASLGALWIGTSTASLRVDEVISTKGTAQRMAEALNLGELLEANVGRQVKVTYAIGGSEKTAEVDATVLSVPKSRKPDTFLPYPGSPQPGIPQPTLAVLQTGDGQMLAIDRNAIRSIVLAGGSPLRTSLDRDIDTAKIRVRGLASGVPTQAEITMAYLERGITWSPSYLVNIASEKEADITLEAVLANDVEDLEDADVSFVAGYPNFMYSDFGTPLSAQQSVSAFVQSLISGPQSNRSSGGYGGAMSQSMMFNVAYDSTSRWQPETAYSAVRPMPGESNEDLYFYHRDHVTLKKGDRARYTVFTAKAPYEHIYQWEVLDTANLDERGYRRDSSDKQDQPDQVWHALKLENNTSQPWTTAPALAVNGSMPVAQDVLKYTPPKGKNTLKLTVATDVRAEQSQVETNRELVKIGYNDYDAVTVSGTLTVKNLKSKGISMDVKKLLTGEVLESGQGSKAVKVAKKVTAVNPQSQIEWEFQLPAGEEKQLTYTYKILLRR